ncbi:hypothetical protein ACLVWU_04145 [Bdellovibrio sp. HCB290]|uniref:hypothetical protein n=1 Tax=Bdellovibrio sp. HCB290 TaxID=3394356 RepID=UPI0039B64D3A
MKKPLILSLCAAAMVVHCSHQEVRKPSSLPNVFTERETQALGQILGGDSPTEKFRRVMTVDFNTNGDAKHLSETAKQSLQNALAKTLGEENPQQGLAKLAMGNIKEEVIENFIKTLKVYKLINLGLQFDLNFAPKPYAANFGPELSSNQLVRLDEVGGLSKKWSLLESQGFTQQIYANSVLVNKDQNADYVGGQISIFIEILDTKPKLGLPKITKNGVKGYVRYRRYFRVNPTLSAGTCNGFGSVVAVSGNVPVFYTVDVYKNFDLKNLIPTEETLEVYPGLIAATQEGRPELLPESSDKYSSVSTMRYMVNQKKMMAHSEFLVKKLVYDLKGRKFDVERSEIEMTSFRSWAKNPRANEESEVKSSARREFFNNCQGVLEKQLMLNQLVPGGIL